jgi:hypothetical protein
MPLDLQRKTLASQSSRQWHPIHHFEVDGLLRTWTFRRPSRQSKIQNRKSKIAPAVATSYLETDQTTNVRFYQRFGYQIVGRKPVLGITTWFMERLANSAAKKPTQNQRPPDISIGGGKTASR